MEFNRLVINSILHGTISLFGLWKNLTGSFLWFLWSIFAAQFIISLIEKKIPDRYKWVDSLTDIL